MIHVNPKYGCSYKHRSKTDENAEKSIWCEANSSIINYQLYRYILDDIKPPSHSLLVKF